MSSGLGRAKDNNDLRMIFREADDLLRRHYGYSNLLKESDWSKEKKKLAEKALEEMISDRKERERRKVVFDFSLLEGIRVNSEAMREKLIVPGSEEEFREDDETASQALPDDVTEEAVQQEDPDGAEEMLNREEKELLALMLSGDSTALGKYGMRLSLLCDSINEKLYGMLGDTAIGFDGDVPVIVEDYIDDVKGALD